MYNIYIYIYIYIYMCMHVYIYIYIHTYIHTYTLPNPLPTSRHLFAPKSMSFQSELSAAASLIAAVASPFPKGLIAVGLKGHWEGRVG